MKNIVWILKPKRGDLDYADLIKAIQLKQPVDLSGYEVLQANSLYSFKEEILEYIAEYGLSHLITSELLLEHVVAKGTPTNQIVDIVQFYLDKVLIDQELIIIDPYFFARTRNSNYITVACDILKKYLSAIDYLIFVTNNTIDTTIKTGIENGLLALKPTLNIQYKQSNDYHDRYWISGAREKGIVMGTSLNGLGNKLALLDRINTSDVRNIVQTLIDDGLI